MDIDSDLMTTAPLPAFQPPPRQDWYYVGYLIGWIISRTQDEFKGLLQQTLPFLFELSTVLERRNELTRRILRILVNSTHSLSPVQKQTGAYWLDLLATDYKSGAHLLSTEDYDEELLNLCRQFGEVAVQN